MRHVIAFAIIVVCCYFAVPFTADVMEIHGWARVLYTAATSILSGYFAYSVTKNI